MYCYHAGVKRRRFVASGVATGLAAAMPGGTTAAEDPSPVPKTPPAPDLEELDLASIRTAIDSGHLNARSLVEAFRERIEALDGSGPALNSIIELDPSALEQAERLDRLPAGERGVLHGVPVLLKDNIEAAGPTATSAGSLALGTSRPDRDAYVTQRLRAAGAVVLGKTNLSEWANIRSSRATSGWSGRGGLTKNPYALDRNPCGSSSGSGVAIAASLAAVALGTETDGSVVCPASTNGIVGIKPTVGLVSRTGIIPIAHSQDTAGPMARTVADAAVLLSVMAGTDVADAATAAAQGHVERDYTRFLLAGGLKGARIGVARAHFGFHPGVDRVMDESLDALKRAGAVLVDPADVPHRGEYDDAELLVLLHELKADLELYLASLGHDTPVKTLADVIAWNEAHADREMPYFGQDLFERAQESGPLSEPKYLAARATCVRLAGAEGIDAVMAEHRLDALVAPTGGPAWVTDLVNGDHYSGGYSTASAVAGYPHVTVPAGHVFGLPVGISFFAGAWSEPMLLRLAFAFEQQTNARRQPRFLPSVELPG